MRSTDGATRADHVRVDRRRDRRRRHLQPDDPRSVSRSSQRCRPIRPARPRSVSGGSGSSSSTKPAMLEPSAWRAGQSLTELSDGDEEPHGHQHAAHPDGRAEDLVDPLAVAAGDGDPQPGPRHEADELADQRADEQHARRREQQAGGVLPPEMVDHGGGEAGGRQQAEGHAQPRRRPGQEAQAEAADRRCDGQHDNEAVQQVHRRSRVGLRARQAAPGSRCTFARRAGDGRGSGGRVVPHQPAVAEETGVGHHPVVRADGGRLDVPAYVTAPRASRTARSRRRRAPRGTAWPGRCSACRRRRSRPAAAPRPRPARPATARADRGRPGRDRPRRCPRSSPAAAPGSDRARPRRGRRPRS